MLEQVLRGDEQALRVRGPGDRADRAVPAFGELGDLARLHVAQVHDHAISLVTGPRHRCPGEPAAIGRSRGQRIGALVRLGQILRGRAFGERLPDNVEIGRARLVAIRFADGKGDGAAVGAPGDFLAAAERLARRIAFDSTAHRARGTGGLAVGRQRIGIDARIGAGLAPAIPMPHEQPVIFAPRTHRLGPGIARIDRASLGDIRPDREAVAIGREAEAAEVHRRLRHLHWLAAGQRDAPHLVGSGAVRQEEQVLAIARKHGRAFVMAGRIGDRDRLGLAVREVEHEQPGAALVRGEIGRGQLIGDPFAIGRRGGCPQPVEGRKVRLGHRPGGGRAGEENGRKRTGDQRGEEHLLHGCRRYHRVPPGAKGKLSPCGR